MTGFMYPLREDPDMTAFLFIEAPVGCWYCEMPETTGIVFVEMPAGQDDALPARPGPHHRPTAAEQRPTRRIFFTPSRTRKSARWIDRPLAA